MVKTNNMHRYTYATVIVVATSLAPKDGYERAGGGGGVAYVITIDVLMATPPIPHTPPAAPTVSRRPSMIVRGKVGLRGMV